jgi:hypothetical protein
MSDYLVCARALDMPVGGATPGSIFNLKCSVCLEHVCMGLAGQMLLAREPDRKIICTQCLEKQIGPTDEINLAPGAAEELRRHYMRGKK